MRKETIHWVFYLRECTVWFTGSNNFLFFSFKKNYLLACLPVNSSSILGLVPLNPKICTRKCIICCLCISNVSASQAAKGKTNSRWPGCGAANINNREKTKQRQSKQTVYKELAASKKTFWKTQKARLICELLTSCTHGPNSKQLVFQTNNSTSSTSCQLEACNFSALSWKAT